ncbi:beta-N-acetylhexosaminidase [Flavivirga eckloniae]|uniref:beta-N-acetylhexosaminidase n=1 Tax=Flavivirga eckloniae TaxID=1803846 RepID=A0A2K9PSM9_9FLAO|nr:beta-N-acetylhexosaminidase [Flavivirga eckloniae]AUP80070.1 beta-N-acetylglucosaminidase [Flavivirga eckloniae]
MNSNLIKLLIVLMITGTNCKSEKLEYASGNLLPNPQEQKAVGGNFLLNSNTKIYTGGTLKKAATFLMDYIANGSNITLEETEDIDAANIIFKHDSNIQNAEGYTLSVTDNRITISAKTEQGAFYGYQSLRQLLPESFENGSYKEKEVAIAGAFIKDAPRFSYRGMHLDVARHFFNVDEVKTYIDYLAMLKFNTFHWHLTEDQGWRIEIKKYPKLTSVGGFRKETLIGHYNDKPQRFDGKKYGGFYTQEEIKDIVKYASDRAITIIPEIEMPGHSLAALSAYPEFGCIGESYEAATKWGVFEDIYCSKESTFLFLQDILDEVIELFPGKYIHIGGDEAPKERWKHCNNCQARIKEAGLKDEHELQSYFITRIETYLNSKGKQLIGWDEILEGGLAPNATVMSWRGDAGAIAAAKQNHDVILTPNTHVYFDHYQSGNIKEEPVAIGGFLPLEKVFNFEPISKELTAEEAKHVLGGQGNVWTEYMPDFKHVEYMLFPRAVALSNVLWGSKDRNYNDFLKRLNHFENRLKALDVNSFKKYKTKN